MKYLERAFAKLNLTLDVLGRRDDGYHEMRMVMQSVDLYDDVSLELEPGRGIWVTSSDPALPDGPGNLAYRAAEELLRELREERRVAVHIVKRIPERAGLAGGSSDAAAVLRGLYSTLRPEGDGAEAYSAALRVGSDVAFCLYGGTALATGRGEVLRPLPDLPECGILIVKPEFSVSTPELFARLDGGEIERRPDTGRVLSALEAGDIRGVAGGLMNVFEGVLPRQYRERVERVKRELLEAGALGAAMTGTGSAVFGIFESFELAENAAGHIEGDVFPVRPLRRVFPARR